MVQRQGENPPIFPDDANERRRKNVWQIYVYHPLCQSS